jgi:hypothetical protein
VTTTSLYFSLLSLIFLFYSPSQLRAETPDDLTSSLWKSIINAAPLCKKTTLFERALTSDMKKVVSWHLGRSIETTKSLTKKRQWEFCAALLSLMTLFPEEEIKTLLLSITTNDAQQTQTFIDLRKIRKLLFNTMQELEPNNYVSNITANLLKALKITLKKKTIRKSGFIRVLISSLEGTPFKKSFQKEFGEKFDNIDHLTAEERIEKFKKIIAEALKLENDEHLLKLVEALLVGLKPLGFQTLNRLPHPEKARHLMLTIISSELQMHPKYLTEERALTDEV